MSQSLGGSIGSAMLQAAHGAMLGKAIGNLNEEAEASYQNVLKWAEHAKSVENKIAVLKTRLSDEIAENAKISQLIDAERNKIDGLKSLNKTLGEAVYAFYAEVGEIHEEIPIVRTRIRQLEKALQHSSADQASLHAVLKPYTELVEAYNLTGQLPQDLKEKAEKVWDAFYSGGQLTADPKIQEILDKPTEIFTIWSP